MLQAYIYIDRAGNGTGLRRTHEVPQAYINNYGFSLDNLEIDEENQHSYEESSESESSDSESSDSESSESENIREARRVSLEQYYGSNS